MTLTWEIAFVFLLLVGALASFVTEKVPPDVTALTLFAIILVTGLVPHEKVLGVLANPAPLTVGAMFILSAALVKCGAIDRLAAAMERLAGLHYFVFMLALVLLVGVISAFVNNTPVVVVFMPVVLGLARKMRLPASKLLIPLSYAAVLGGTCTLLGTSTNLVVAGIVRGRGLPPLGMFELAQVGVPLLAAGMFYIALFGKKLLPAREMLTAILSEDERREYITEAFVHPETPVIGRTLSDAGLTGAKGIRVIEIVRNGVAIHFDAKTTPLEAGDRIIMACRAKGIAHTRGIEGVDLVSEMNLGLEQIATHEGAIVEGIIGPNSTLAGHTVGEVNFRQRYRMVVLAVHRRGRNLREKVESLPLKFGDILLMMGTDQAIEQLRSGEDILLIDRPPLPVKSRGFHMPLVLGTIAAVVAASTFNLMPIEVAAIIACIVIFLTRCLKSKDGYASIEWNILFLIYGMLAMGLLMEETGASVYIVDRMLAAVNHFVPPEHKPLVMLAMFYLVATVLTEILSNNAVAALMAPLAISLAEQLGVDSRPFIIVVCIAASAAFATPIGYQTNTYVYGVGGYRFTDFVKFGAPLNLICFAVSMYIIPRIWPF